MSKPTTAIAHRWMEKGIAENVHTRTAFEKTKAHALTTGYYFLKAREHWDGDFKELCLTYKDKIGFRTIQRACEFTSEALAWVVRDNPALQHDVEAQLKEAFKMTLESPKPLVGLLRALKKSNATGNPNTDFQVMPFGLYIAKDPAEEKIKKLLGSQREFSFVTMLDSLDVLAVPGDDNCQFIFPEGRDEVEVIDEALTKARAIVARLEQIKQTKSVIEA